MNTKIFGLLLVLVLIVLGVAALSLFDDSSNSGDPSKNEPVVKTEKQDPKSDGNPVAPTIEPTRNPIKPDESVRSEQPSTPAFVPRGQLIVRGNVTSKTAGTPIADATVKVCDEEGDAIEEVQTKPDGTYEIMITGTVPPKVDVVALAEEHAASHSVNDVSIGDVREMTIDFQLLSAFYIEGRVTSLATGEPISEVEVNLRSRQMAFGESWESEETDANGFYKIGPITDLPRDGFDITIDPSDFAPQLKRDLAVEVGQNTLRVDFQLYSTLKIRGSVVSLATGKPIAEAVVNGQSADEDFIDLGESESTNDDGTFELELSSSPYEGLFLLATADDHSAKLVESLPAPAVDGTIDVGAIALPPQVTLRGLVVNALTGAPVTGGDIAVYAKGIAMGKESDYTDNDTIDSNGTFEIKLENSTPAACELVVEADGAVEQRVDVAVPPNSAIFDVRVSVQPTLQFSGVIARQVDNSPVMNAIVRVRVGRSAPVTSRTSPDGKFKLELPPNVDLDATEVTIAVLDKKFSLGAVPKPPQNSFQIEKNYTVDVPAPRR